MSENVKSVSKCPPLPYYCYMFSEPTFLCKLIPARKLDRYCFLN